MSSYTSYDKLILTPNLLYASDENKRAMSAMAVIYAVLVTYQAATDGTEQLPPLLELPRFGGKIQGLRGSRKV